MINVPVFPDRRPLLLEDKALFDPVFMKFPPSISEYTFTNLFAWRRAYQFTLSQLSNVLLVAAQNTDRIAIFDPIGPLDLKRKTIERCFELAEEEMFFSRLSQETADFFRGDRAYRLVEERNQFDYVYYTKDMVALKGRAFDGKRNFIKRFKDQVLFEYHPLTYKNALRCLSFKEEWCLAKDCVHSEGLMREKEALEEMLLQFDELKMAGALVEINGKVEAVTLGEPLNPETFVIHIEKANGAFIGIYQVLNQMFAEAQAADYTYINREQDLGVPGLRKSKESYHPCRMVKKFTLAKK
jgi:hypothetical protein